uniref:Uncharacterized protein n=1 Tax=Neisseria meningitidis alpha522 TaxID=996307 RepID=I4E710_NEIME|nr:hypothetical protein NMALPHA522_1587 [Neisseria meningitidis alpha522]
MSGILFGKHQCGLCVVPYTILSVQAIAIAEIKKQTCTRHCRISCFSDRLAKLI